MIYCLNQYLNSLWDQILQISKFKITNNLKIIKNLNLQRKILGITKLKTQYQKEIYHRVRNN